MFSFGLTLTLCINGVRVNPYSGKHGLTRVEHGLRLRLGVSVRLTLTLTNVYGCVRDTDCTSNDVPLGPTPLSYASMLPPAWAMVSVRVRIDPSANPRCVEGSTLISLTPGQVMG